MPEKLAETPQQELARLRAENEELRRRALMNDAIEGCPIPEIRADARRRMELGLSPQQAMEAARAQYEHDAKLGLA